MAVFEDTIYWSDWSAFSLESCNKFTGHDVKLLVRENGVHIMGVHVYHPLLMATGILEFVTIKSASNYYKFPKKQTFVINLRV